MANKTKLKTLRGLRTVKVGKKKAKTSARQPANNPVPVPKLLSSVMPQKQQAKLGHVHRTCSMTDPFCVHARGAQRADGGPPTIPYQLRGLLNVNADTTTGGQLMTFVPNPAFQYNLATASAGPPAIWTGGTAWLQAFTGTFLSTTNVKEIRIVSFGVVLRCALSATNAKGSVIVSSVSAPVVSEVTPQGNMANQESQIHTVAAGSEITWISKPLGPSAHLFKQFAGFTSTYSDFDWTSLRIEIAGADTTNLALLYTAEFVMNVEFTMNGATSGMANLAKPPAAPSRTALAAADHVRAATPSFLAGGIEKIGRSIESYANKALDSMMSEGLMFLGL